jgi:hypothetical protein
MPPAQTACNIRLSVKKPCSVSLVVHNDKTGKSKTLINSSNRVGANETKEFGVTVDKTNSSFLLNCTRWSRYDDPLFEYDIDLRVNGRRVPAPMIDPSEQGKGYCSTGWIKFASY